MPFDKTQTTGIDPRLLHWFPAVDSTMHEAARLAQLGAPHGTIVGADQQTAGLGRQGHTWHSEPDAGLYVSFVLKVAVAITEVPVVTLALGLAAAEAITKTAGVACDLRWPNDVLIQEKKVCGILTQLHSSAIVAGIGINVNHSVFPPALSSLATSLRLASGMVQSRETLLSNLAASVQSFLTILTHDGKESLLRLFENASSYVRGRRVIVEERMTGITAGLNHNGFLTVKQDDGTETIILAGGVRPA